MTLAVPSFDIVKANLDKFYQKLNQVQVFYIYFDSSLKPHITDLDILKKWVIDDISYYVLQKSWYIIYIGSELKRLINLSQFNAEPYAGKEYKELDEKTGEPTVITPDENIYTIGNHFSIGISKLRVNQNILFRSHYTYYDHDDENDNKFVRDQNTCNFKLIGKIDDSIICEEVNVPNNPTNNISTKYNNKSHIIINLVNNHILQDTTPNTGGGNKKYYKYNGRRYLVKTGSKGGKYIEFTNKKIKYYITKKQQGGGIPFTIQFIDFIRLNVLIPFRTLKSNLESVEIFYDQASEFGNNDYITIIYHFEHTIYRYFLDASVAYDAYQAYDLYTKSAVSLPEKQQIYNSFKTFVATENANLIAVSA